MPMQRPMIKSLIQSHSGIRAYSVHRRSATRHDHASVLNVQRGHCAQRRAIRVLVLIVQVHLLIFSCAVWGFDLTAGFKADDLIYPASLFVLLITVWSLWSWNLFNKSLFDPYSLFLISVTAFNAGQAFLEVFHLNENGILGGAFLADTILKSLLLVAMGISGLHLGALVSAGTIKEPRSCGRTVRSIPTLYLRWVAWPMLLIAIPFRLVAARDAVGVVLSSGYSGLYQQTAITGISAAGNVLSEFWIPGAIFLLAGSKKWLPGVIVAAIVIVLNTLVDFFLGARSAAVLPLIAFAWLCHRHVRRLPAGLLVAVVIAMLVVVFPIVFGVRNMSGPERLSIGNLKDASLSIDNPAIATLDEMGGSLATVAYTVELVPSARPYDCGIDYLYAASTLFPNLFWDVHPAVARGLLSSWLVWEVDPFFAEAGGSYDFSCIAEAYLNFGWIGVPAVMLILGLLYSKFVLWAQRSRDPLKLAMVATYGVFFLKYARTEACWIVRPLVWYALLPYALVLLVARLRPCVPEQPSSPARSMIASSPRILRSKHERTRSWRTNAELPLAGDPVGLRHFRPRGERRHPH